MAADVVVATALDLGAQEPTNSEQTMNDDKAADAASASVRAATLYMEAVETHRRLTRERNDDGLWISPMGDGPPDPVVPWQEYRPGMILRPLDGRPPRYLLSEVRADGLGIVYIIRDKYGATCCKRTTLALWVVEPVVLP